MADRVFRMTAGHLVRWTITYGVFVGVWTWYVAASSGVLRMLGVVLGLLALRGLVGTVVAFARRPSLIIGPEALTVTQVVGARDVRWADCSDFRPVLTISGGHVRYHDGARRRSLPAGFAGTDRRLTANELADVLNRARDAAGRDAGAASA